MAFGANPTTGTQGALASNQFPLSSVAVPGNANGDLTALQGGPSSSDSNGNLTAPASMYTYDGNSVTFGAKADSAATSNTGSFSYMALFKRLLNLISGVLAVSLTPATNTTATLQNAATATGSGTQFNFSGMSSVVFTVTGTFVGTITFKGVSADGATISNINCTQLGTTNIGPTATAPGLYECGATNLSAVQAVITGYTSGSITVTASASPGPYSTRTVNSVAQVSSSGGSVPYHNLTAATTNFTSVKTTAVKLYSLRVANTSGSTIYVKFYDKASTPATSDTPKDTLMVNAGSSYVLAFPEGMQFSNGFGWAATGAVTDSDNTSITANCVVDFNLSY